MATSDSDTDPDDSAGSLQDDEQLWHSLNQVVHTSCPADDHETIDDALREWLILAARCRRRFAAQTDDEDPNGHGGKDDRVSAVCAQGLLAGRLFQTNPDYVRTQIIYSLLQEDDVPTLFLIASLLLHDGRSYGDLFRRMADESCFSRLLDLLNQRRHLDPSLHRLLLELMYEISRIDQLRLRDLLHVDDAFIGYLFQLIEELSDDVDDPYHYPIIRVLLVLNEQYMVASTTATIDSGPNAAPLTNRVVKCLSLNGPEYRTFGENLILLLNRETETSLQLLILKLLYLLFTTRATYEYFYTNDLRVLLDVIIRNLLDLPNELTSLRHTYLRVLYPLLAHTQLSQPLHYKKEEILKVLGLLAGSGSFHFAPADDTTVRLVDRVGKVKWLQDDGSGSGEVARKFIGMSLSNSDSASNTSVSDVAAVMEKPGVMTPSRNGDGVQDVRVAGEHKDNLRGDGTPPTPDRAKKPAPAVPKHRHGKAVVAPSASGSTGPEPLGKKLPPQAPPPRRKGRLKTVTQADEIVLATSPTAAATASTTITTTTREGPPP